MLKPDEKVLKAMARLQNNEDFKTFSGWLQGSLEKYRAESDEMPIEQIANSQGKRQTIKKILDLAGTSRAMLENIQKKQ